MFQSTLCGQSPRRFFGGQLSQRLHTWIHPLCISNKVDPFPWLSAIAKTGTPFLGKIVSGEKCRPRDHCQCNQHHREIPPTHIHFLQQKLQTLFHKWRYTKLKSHRKWICLHQWKGRSWLHRLFHQSCKVNCQYPVILSLDCIISHFLCPSNIFMQSKSDYCAIDSFSFTQEIDCFIYGPFKIYVKNSSHIRIRENPGKPMTIYDVSSIVEMTLPRALVGWFYLAPHKHLWAI